MVPSACSKKAKTSFEVSSPRKFMYVRGVVDISMDELELLVDVDDAGWAVEVVPTEPDDEAERIY